MVHTQYRASRNVPLVLTAESTTLHFPYAPAPQHVGGEGAAQIVCLESPPVIKMAAAEEREPSWQ